MIAVCIRGSAVQCALGTHRSECTDALRQGRTPVPRLLPVPGLTPPVQVHFHPLAGTDDPFAPGRMQTLLPTVVHDAMHEAALSTAERTAMPVFIGSSCFSIRDAELAYAQALADNPTQALPMPHIDMGSVARGIRDQVGSHAADFSFNTACSSASNALLAAMRYLRAGLARHALVVGVELANLTSLAGFSSLQLLGDRIAPFAADRSATVLGEGIGAVVLEAGGTGPFRLSGGASAVDTHSVTITNPDGSSIAKVIEQALRMAAVEPDQIRAIKSHATGTPSNDEAEANGLHRIFSALPPVCTLKPWIGHTLGACGVVELVLLADTLAQVFLPGTPCGPLDAALNVTPLQHASTATPGHYLLNQFGFGGNNAVLVLEWTC